MLKQLIIYYKSLHPISKDFEKEVYKHAYSVVLKDKEVLLEQDTFCDSMYFVGQGLLVADSKIKRRRITSWFSKPGDAATSISGLYGIEKSKERIYSIGETFLLGIKSEVILSWYHRFPEYNFITRKIFEKYFQVAEERVRLIKIGTAKERYEYYKESLVDYVDIIPLDIVASYLSIKGSTLDKIIKEENRKSNLDIESFYKKLLSYLEEEKSYLQNTLTLKSLSDSLNISSQTLSQIVNIKSNKNFNDFINSYRIAYVQERLKNNDDWKYLTLETLGFEAGFKSRSSFFSVFKKQVGVSPSVYLQSLLAAAEISPRR